jgi:hypothetical protein
MAPIHLYHYHSTIHFDEKGTRMKACVLSLLVCLGLVLAVVCTTAHSSLYHRATQRPVLDDGLPKDDAFTGCCQQKSIFQSTTDLNSCCVYSQLNCQVATLEALTTQQQSDWLHCFGDSQNDVDCCTKAGVG